MIATNKITETQQITKFVDDVQIENYLKPSISTPLEWTSMAHDDKMHSISDILSRPVLIESGQINNILTEVSHKFPDAIFNNSPNVVDKLNYFTFLRANVKIKFMFNATPFMSGKYWMFFAPFEEECNRPRTGSIQNATGYPGVEIDLANGAPVEIKIPYCAPLSHYNLVDTHSNMGTLYIVPLNSIQAGDSPAPSASFSIFAWFEDVELALPTSKPVMLPLLKAQVYTEEQEATNGATISGTMQKVAAIAETVEGVAPIMDRPVEWVTRAVSGAISMMGWNKPTTLENNHPYANIPAKGYTNCDGHDISAKLGAMPDNAISNFKGMFSSDADEMDINYVVSKSCIQRSNINWDLTQGSGTLLHAIAVSPGSCDGVASELYTTTLGFVSSMFRYWRGGIKYRISAAKTAFHTGRVRITYSPGVHSSTGLDEQNAYNWILDLSTSSEIEFVIPYVSNVPWKEVLVAAYNESSWQFEKYSTGTLTITVLNNLKRASESVADNVPMNVWISGADDMSFAIPDFGSYNIVAPSNMLLRDLRAQVFNETDEAISHNEQVRDGSGKMFPKSLMSLTGAEEMCMGEKIMNLRQVIKRFALTSIGKPYPYKNASGNFVYPGPVPLNNDNYLFNQLVIDPAFFGDSTIGTVPRSQTELLPVTRKPDGTFDTSQFVVADHFQPRCPLHYISYLYRFYRGGKRYKVATPATNGLRSTNTGWRSADDQSANGSTYVNVMDGVTNDAIRPSDPLFVTKDWQITTNGLINPPAIGTFLSSATDPTFEHYVYPDLNGTCEFEVPYYSQLPISLIGQGDISQLEGPLMRRSLIAIRRSPDPRGLDSPVYQYYNDSANPTHGAGVKSGGIRNTFGGYLLYEAAADDFSFGYLVGPPSLNRLIT